MAHNWLTHNIRRGFCYDRYTLAIWVRRGSGVTYRRKLLAKIEDRRLGDSPIQWHTPSVTSKTFQLYLHRRPCVCVAHWTELFNNWLACTTSLSVPCPSGHVKAICITQGLFFFVYCLDCSNNWAERNITTTIIFHRFFPPALADMIVVV